MLRTQRIHLTSMIGAIVLTVAILSTAIIMTSPSARSSISDNLSGYAWSETIGWISFNSTNEAGATAPYGVTVATGGALSGYAWSENIGWISFNASDVSGCPAGTCAPSLDRSMGANKGVVSGWARALSPTSGVNTGGWDGWISLNCANNGACGTSDYKVRATDCSWGGFAWGGDVVGWISIGGAAGGNVTGTAEGCHPIQYSCVGTAPANATTCSLASDPDQPTEVNRIAVLDCSDPASTKCNFTCNLDYHADGTGTMCDSNACNNGSDDDGDGLTDFGAGVNNDPGCTGPNDNSESGIPPTLTINPRTVDGSGIGGNTVVTWNTGDVPETACTLQGGNGAYLTPTSAPFTADDGVGDDLFGGTVNVAGIKARTTYTIRCDGQSVSATVEIIPIGTET